MHLKQDSPLQKLSLLSPISWLTICNQIISGCSAGFCVPLLLVTICSVVTGWYHGSFISHSPSSHCTASSGKYRVSHSHDPDQNLEYYYDISWIFMMYTFYIPNWNTSYTNIFLFLVNPIVISKPSLNAFGKPIRNWNRTINKTPTLCR